jgi:glucose/mannose-6-phosphate isomerase
VNLDDVVASRTAFAATDTADALADVEATPQQWRQARARAVGRLDLDRVTAVVMTGMGGSGITGDVAAELAVGRLGVPVVVHKGYGLPAFVGPSTLVVAVSYSGDTEETCSAFAEARRRGAALFAVTSGGAIGSECATHGIRHATVPGGGQPRHSLGWLAVPVLVALGLDEGLGEAIEVMEDLAASCAREVPVEENLAKHLGTQLAAGGPVVAYGGQGLGRLAAYRLKCQLNENAKLPAGWGELPEMNHNEIVGWQDDEATGGVVWLRDPTGEHPRVAQRIALTQELIAERVSWTAEITARGRAPLARLTSLLLFGDLTSVYAAIARGVDPTPIPNIARLKTQLGQRAGQEDP